jgi:hypothetical protein
MAGVPDGRMQVNFYALLSYITSGGNNMYSPNTDFLFRGDSSIRASRVFGTYTFVPAADGVVAYVNPELNTNVQWLPYWVGGLRSLRCIVLCIP